MKNLFSLTILLGLCAFIQADKNLPFCPKGLKPYSQHNLKPVSFNIFVTGIETWPKKGKYNTYISIAIFTNMGLPCIFYHTCCPLILYDKQRPSCKILSTKSKVGSSILNYSEND